jgi:serine/alanine adding enzyme
MRYVESGPRRTPCSIRRVVQALDRDRWTAYVEHHPAGTIFHTPEMQSVFVRARHHQPTVWATLDAAGEIQALMTPVAIATVGGPLRHVTTRIVGFGGPLTLPGQDGCVAFQTLLRSFQARTRHRALFTELRNATDTSELAPALAACTFVHEAHLNFLVDLTPGEDKLWQRIKPAARRNINKAERLGVRVTEARGERDLEAGYRVLRDVYARIRVPLPDRSLFAAAQEVLGPLGRFRMLLASVQEQTIGVLTLLLWNDVAQYWYTGTLRSHAEFRAGDLLVWRAIDVARRYGCRIFDFGGAGKPDEPYGVRDFKAKYGGRLVDYGRDTWVSAPVRLRMATVGYEKVRRFL